MFNNKVVLVTGGEGFIGSHLVDACLNLGAEKVVSFDNLVGVTQNNFLHRQQDIANKRLQIVQGDIKDYQTIKPFVEEADVIFNEAASKLVVSLKDPMIDVQTNVLGNFNILEIMRKCNSQARIIHASTGSIFGSSHKPFAEDDAKHPSTIYGISKLAADFYHQFYAKEYGIKSSVLRYFHVFGPRQDYAGEAGVISIFLSRVLQGKPPIVFGSGEQIRCFTFVTDDVHANLLLYKNNITIGKAYNVASKTRISVLDLAKLIIKKYGPEGMQPIMGPPRMGENMKPIPDTSKIEALGFREQVSFEQGLEQTKQWIAKELEDKNKGTGL